MAKHRSTYDSRRGTRLTALALSVPLALVLPGVAFADTPDSNAGGSDTGLASQAATPTVGMNRGNRNTRVTICHATGSTTNPYVQITPNKNGVVKGHAGDGHQDGEDIIPAFTYNDHGTTKPFAGQNLDARGQAILANGCKIPVDSTAGPGSNAEIITICHATHSDTNPFVVISLSEDGVLNGHVGTVEGHQDGEDIIPAFNYVDKDGNPQRFAGQNLDKLDLIDDGCDVDEADEPDTKTVIIEKEVVKEVIVEKPVIVEKTVVVETPVIVEKTVVVETPVIVERTVLVPAVPPTLGGGTPILGQPVAQPATQPVAQPATQPVAQPVAQPVTLTGDVPFVGPVLDQPATGGAVVDSGTGGTTLVAGGAASPSALPFTGVDTSLLAISAGLMIALGGVMVAATRRRELV